tara:strand:+ start:263 stop:892 length:630 start_codon:yes stop_codon:yes gene_type:complete
MNRKTRDIALSVGILLIVIFAFNGFDKARAAALVAEERVRILEEERIELELEMEEAAEGYELLRDSLDQAHDSIAEIRAEAAETASIASVDFAEDVALLRDSIMAIQPDSGLGEILDRIQIDHEIEVEAYEVQIQTLEADKALLWQRVETLDSLWTQEENLNAALRNEIAALNQESDAWRRAANPNILKKLRGGIPYLLVGAGAVSLLN